MMGIVSTVFKNKVFLYLGSRYITYALQFATSFYIALKLGPTSFGIWSFILLLINFYYIVDFGISNSINILLVQDKENEVRCLNHILSSIIITFGLCILIVLSFIVIKYCRFDFLVKYDIDIYLPAILYIVIVRNFNKVFSSIYRVKNRLLELAFFQSIVPVLLLLVIIFSSTNSLWYLVGAYIVGQSLALLLFVFRGQISIKGSISFLSVNAVFYKGFWLFLYNGLFYLIMFSTSSFVSTFYSVSDYGKYSFAYSLAHSIFLFLEAFGYIVFPKIIQKLKGNDFDECKVVICTIRNSYLTIVHGLVYLAFPIFYLLCMMMPQYSNMLRMLCIASLTILPYVNAFGLNTFLMAQNKEKTIAIISFASFIMNILFLFLFIQILHFPYDLILLATMISYVLFTLLCSFFMLKIVGESRCFALMLKTAFPVRISIPYVIALCIVLLFSKEMCFMLLFIPLLVFISLNRDLLRETMRMMVRLIKKPEIVDLK
ncbi:lipopolysaccharide biosynthesis protein [Butyricimonas paravirosa]|uniref:lipopolysaccharide biosynthesis protein n=1 Tax=Butyricimonas paravirosa TaxID=1472417 RepID=UPI0022E81601|nr:oligosaccharide flippase family protein [Butyricimonas paravirosa]